MWSPQRQLFCDWRIYKYIWLDLTCQTGTSYQFPCRHMQPSGLYAACQPSWLSTNSKLQTTRLNFLCMWRGAGGGLMSEAAAPPGLGLCDHVKSRTCLDPQCKQICSSLSAFTSGPRCLCSVNTHVLVACPQAVKREGSAGPWLVQQIQTWAGSIRYNRLEGAAAEPCLHSCFPWINS